MNIGSHVVLYDGLADIVANRIASRVCVTQALVWPPCVCVLRVGLTTTTITTAKNDGHSLLHVSVAIQDSQYTALTMLVLPPHGETT